MPEDEPTLSELLRCPQTHQRLLPITSTWCDRLNARIHAGELHTESGDVVDELIDGGLITEDDRYLYPIRGGVPSLMVSDRIVLAS
jgi:uncharacterized protein YbaR (Trm112 family)